MVSLSFADILGAAASLLTLAAFMQRRMFPMRIAAIGANSFFIAYGAIGSIYPVLALHLILLPVNVMRFAGEIVRRRSGAASAPAPAASHPLCWMRSSRFAPTCSCQP